MLNLLRNLQVGDKFIDLADMEDLVYTVVSTPIDGYLLCQDEEGFGELFPVLKIVRLVK